MSKFSSYIALIGISLLSFTAYLDVTIVSTALPDIQTSLHMTVSELQWVMNACFLGVSAFMASMGRLADIYGRRKVFYIGTLIFGFASISAGLSSTAIWLILFRAIQGITAAIILPVGVALISTLFNKNDIAKAMGIFGIITGAGLALGPVVGGALVSVFSWPAVFFVNIPFIIVGFAMCFFTVKESYSQAKMQIDYLGMIFLILTISSLVFAMVEGTNYGWDSPLIICSFLLFIVSLIFLIVVEKRVSDPIIDESLFKNPAFLTTVFVFFVAGGLMAVILFIDPLYLHLILNKSIWMTGIYLFIIPLTSMLASPFIGKLNQLQGPRRLIIYSAILFIVASILQSLFDAEFNLVWILVGFISFGLAWSISCQSPAIYIAQMIKQDHISVALGTLYSFWNIGAAVLLALGASLFHLSVQQSISHQLISENFVVANSDQIILNQFVKQPDQMLTIINKLSLPHAEMKNIFTQAFLSGMHAMFWPLIVFSTIVFLAFVLLKSKKVVRGDRRVR
ncbi:MAG: MFS transporter [Gammaproteobacteria bacterium]|nr:MFS transporter [Gammaproteobacteria bacterium]